MHFQSVKTILASWLFSKMPRNFVSLSRIRFSPRASSSYFLRSCSSDAVSCSYDCLSSRFFCAISSSAFTRSVMSRPWKRSPYIPFMSGRYVTVPSMKTIDPWTSRTRNGGTGTGSPGFFKALLPLPRIISVSSGTIPKRALLPSYF